MDEMDEDKKKKKGTISEDDMSLLLPKYSVATIIAVLQEISQSNDVDMDWDALAKNTSTGITNPREYQMLWRHLAYRNSLAEGIDENAQVLDDDSDLEHELEPYPPTNDEALNEAAAYVKVLLASNLPNDPGPPNSSIVEAPLTINIPNSQASCAPSDNPQSLCPQGTNITVPVSVQKQSVAAPTITGGLDVNGLASGSLPPRKKRKPWTPEEDLELIAAVEKYGERNWANILKGDFKGERSASQLSQRWAIIRKKRQTNPTPVGVTNVTSSQLSEAQLAARHALHAALNIPMTDSLSAASSVGVTPSCNPSTSSAVPAAPNEAPPVSGAPMESSTKPTVSNSFSQAVHQNQQAPHQITTSFQKGTSGTASQAVHQSQQAPHQTTTSFQKGTSGTASQAVHQNQQAPHQTTTSFQKGTSVAASQAVHQNQQAPQQTTTSFQKGTSGTAAKSRIIPKKTAPIPVKAPVGPNPMIQAAAVAAGARIITSTEASLLKAAQSKNAVHIRPGGGSLIKPALPGSTKPLPPNPNNRSNVHYIRTGLPSASQPPPTFSTVVPSIPQSGCTSQQAHGNSVGSAAVTCQVPSAVTASSSLPVAASFGASGVKSSDAILTVDSGILSVEEVMKSVEEMKVESSVLSTQEVKSVQKMKVENSADEVKCSGQDDQADLPNSDMFIKKEVTMENLRNTSQEMEVDEKEQKPVVGKLTEKQPAVTNDLQDGTTMQKAGSPCHDETTMMEASSPCQDVTMNENQNHCS